MPATETTTQKISRSTISNGVTPQFPLFDLFVNFTEYSNVQFRCHFVTTPRSAATLWAVFFLLSSSLFMK